MITPAAEVMNMQAIQTGICRYIDVMNYKILAVLKD